jgi:glucoamylase
VNKSYPDLTNVAPGWPGIPARWTSSAKSGVGKALNDSSPLWFTISHGILNEIYYPRIDQACVRDIGFIVTDGVGFFSEEKRHTTSEIISRTDGIPAFKIINTCKQGFYQIETDIIADPRRPVLLQRSRFTVLKKSAEEYQLFLLVAPHLGNYGDGNTGWIGDYKGVPMLFAKRDHFALAVACSLPWRKRSVGFVGFSDGWTDIHENKKMTKEYARAENGNVALTAKIDLRSAAAEFVIAVGFGTNEQEAGIRARFSLRDSFDVLYEEYVDQWKTWQASLLSLPGSSTGNNIYRISTSVLRVHDALHFPGGSIASLSVPWGFTKGDNDLGGYHLVWPRDMVQTAQALIACGATDATSRSLGYLECTQEADGHWPQNMWLDGSPYWKGVQMDETALPILLVDLAYREKVIDKKGVKSFWQMVKKAAAYLVQNGPVSPQDRWEENPGYSTFTVAAEIAALLAAADIADMSNEASVGTYLREVADSWNACIDRWMYVTENDWCEKYGVGGYYVRVAEITRDKGTPHVGKDVLVKNHSEATSEHLSHHLISPDVLALVRFGLRDAHDLRILNTVKIVDALLKTDTPKGPIWHRYNEDGYGEHEDGAPFDGTGIGRAWPLLTGERAHYELAAGNTKQAKKLLETMELLANEGGLLPEQTWDTTDIPERELYLGRPSGSAMPLVWAHAEYIKLLRSLREGKVFDMPLQTVKRYLIDKIVSNRMLWSFNNKLRSMPFGRILRVETLAPVMVKWTSDDWSTFHEGSTIDSGLGVHFNDIPTNEFPEGTEIIFTLFWKESKQWEEVNFLVTIDSEINGIHG